MQKIDKNSATLFKPGNKDICKCAKNKDIHPTLICPVSQVPNSSL